MKCARRREKRVIAANPGRPGGIPRPPSRSVRRRRFFQFRHGDERTTRGGWDARRTAGAITHPEPDGTWRIAGQSRPSIIYSPHEKQQCPRPFTRTSGQKPYVEQPGPRTRPLRWRICFHSLRETRMNKIKQGLDRLARRQLPDRQRGRRRSRRMRHPLRGAQPRAPSTASDRGLNARQGTAGHRAGGPFPYSAAGFRQGAVRQTCFIASASTLPGWTISQEAGSGPSDQMETKAPSR